MRSEAEEVVASLQPSGSELVKEVEAHTFGEGFWVVSLRSLGEVTQVATPRGGAVALVGSLAVEVAVVITTYILPRQCLVEIGRSANCPCQEWYHNKIKWPTAEAD